MSGKTVYRIRCRSVTCLVVLMHAAVRADAPRPCVAMSPAQLRVVRFDRFGPRPDAIGGRPGEISSLTNTDWQVGFSYTYHASVTTDPRDGRPLTAVRLDSLTITGHQQTTIYLPADASQRMADHEQGHADLNAYGYRELAGRADRFGRALMQREFLGSCERDALDGLNACFRDEFRDPYADWRDAMHHYYNAVDQNGHCRTVTPQRALQMTLQSIGR